MVFPLSFSPGFRYHLPDSGEGVPITLAQHAQWLTQSFAQFIARLNEMRFRIRVLHRLAPQVLVVAPKSQGICVINAFWQFKSRNQSVIGRF
jgi:hypothetical protein